LCTLKSEKGGVVVSNVIKKSGVENRLMDFFPSNNQQQTEENFKRVFASKDLPEVVAFRKQVAAANIRQDLITALNDAIAEEKPAKEMVAELKELSQKTGVSEPEVVVLVWQCVMTNGIEWNKKEDLLQDQALRHVKQHIPLLAAFTSTFKSEVNLLNKIQEFCYDNMNFLKSFNKIIVLLYKTDVLSEEAVLKWYKESHSQRGWQVFSEQMKKFVEWLEQAEEESDDDEDE